MLSAWLLTGLQALSDGIVPRLDDVRLHVEGTVLSPVPESLRLLGELPCGSGVVLATSEGWQYRAAGEARRLDADPATWSWLAASATHAYFVDGTQPLALQRVALDDGRRLEAWSADDLRLGLELGVQRAGRVSAALCDGERLFVERRDEPRDSARPWAYERHVICLDARSGERRWVRTFECADLAPRPAAVLLAPMLTGPGAPELRSLTLFGDQLVLAHEPQEPLVSLSVADGAERWRLERVWEFERGYIGPSVWQHFVGRFGIQAANLDPAGYTEDGRAGYEALRKLFDERRLAFDRHSLGTLACGPFAVERRTWRKERSLLVVAVVAPNDEWTRQREQAWLYEIDERGAPIAVAALPRRPSGGGAVELGESVLLPCSTTAFACVASSRATQAAFPGSGHDAVASVPWFRELRFEAPRAWLASDPAARPIALSKEFVVSVADGGWVEKGSADLMRFPLWILDPKRGSERLAELRVPIDGKLTLPETNYSSDGVTVRTWGPTGLGLTGLVLAAGALQVTLANESRSWTVTFLLNGLTSDR